MVGVVGELDTVKHRLIHITGKLYFSGALVLLVTGTPRRASGEASQVRISNGDGKFLDTKAKLGMCWADSKQRCPEHVIR